MSEVVVALLTPFGADGRPDREALAAHVEYLLAAGVDGLMPGGTTGEGLLLDDDEIVELVAATVRAAGGRARVLAHVGRPATATTARVAAAAVAAGADAVSALVPWYYTLGDEQIVRHFRALLDAAGGADVYAYTLPARTGNELSPAAVRELAAHGLRGVKDSTKSRGRLYEYLDCGVDVLVGTDAFVREALDAGAAGCVSALANVRPDLLCALRDGGGEEVQAELLALRDELPFGRLKVAVAAHINSYPAAYRPPLS
jgi:dihydrodipicolinate synthase/N-acetylneuraminate lyase